MDDVHVKAAVSENLQPSLVVDVHLEGVVILGRTLKVVMKDGKGRIIREEVKEIDHKG